MSLSCVQPFETLRTVTHREWVVIPFSRGSSWPRDRIQVFCTADRFFTIWATREARAGSMDLAKLWINIIINSRSFGLVFSRENNAHTFSFCGLTHKFSLAALPDSVTADHGQPYIYHHVLNITQDTVLWEGALEGSLFRELIYKVQWCWE